MLVIWLGHVRPESLMSDICYLLYFLKTEPKRLKKTQQKKQHTHNNFITALAIIVNSTHCQKGSKNYECTQRNMLC